MGFFTEDDTDSKLSPPLNNTSVSQDEINIDESVCTGIIYSISDLFRYTVEIRQSGTSSFIKDKDDIKQFGNLESAKKAAYDNNAEKLYLANSLVYDEVGANNNISSRRFDYLLIT